MVNAEVIFKYFPDLPAEQRSQIEQLYPLYSEWNEKINVISRKDIDELYVRHVLHALAIAKFVDFSNCHSILDIGTGGGFPGIPLAILFPHIQFHLVDSIGKKINVVSAVAESLKLENVKAEHSRAEQVRDKYDIIMCRAVTRLLDFYGWIHKNTKPDTEVVCLKGGDLVEEIYEFRQKHRQKKVKVFDISDAIDLPFFETKKVLVIK
jgi:16S rRNA (guanine527-N7)-methyltransferase